MAIKQSLMVLGAGSFLALGVAVVPTTAFAQRCCVDYDYNYEDKGNTLVINQLSERINAMELAIIESLRLGTGQLSGNLKEQIGADSNLANAQDDRAVVRSAEEARINAVKEAVSGASSCSAISTGAGASSIDAGAKEFSIESSKFFTDWLTGGENLPSSRGTDAAITGRLVVHCSRFGNEQDVASGLCDDVGELPNASINASQSLFYSNGNSQTLSPERLAAAEAFLVNALAPEPAGAMLQGEAQTPAGAAEAARRMSENSRYSISYDSGADYLSRRASQTSPGDTYTSHIQDLAGKITGYSGDFSNGVSWHDMMDVRARAWHQNTSWGVDVDSGNIASAIKDMVMMTAYQTYLDWETYKLIEKQNVILASILSIDVEGNRR